MLDDCCDDTLHHVGVCQCRYGDVCVWLALDGKRVGPFRWVPRSLAFWAVCRDLETDRLLVLDRVSRVLGSHRLP